MTDDHPRLEIFGVGIGVYRNPAHRELAVDDELRTITELLADFGAVENPWDAPELRGADLVNERLQAWGRSSEPGTFLWWLGHGVTDQVKAVLLHSLSGENPWFGGIEPTALATYIVERDNATTADDWSVIVIDACGSSTFVKRLGDALDRSSSDRRTVLIGTSGDGATRLGRFSQALQAVLADTFAANQQIKLWDLCGELRLALPDAEIVPKNIGTFALVRRTPVLSEMTVDHAIELRQTLTGLSDDERRHFVAKAQGGELGDESWYYQERSAESRQVVAWLRFTTTGMLVVTGPPGAGKSALLGQLMVRSRPDVYAVLERLELMAEVPARDRPPADVFDLSLHLTGLATADVLEKIAGGVLDADPPPARLDDQIEWLLASLVRRATPLTLLLDGLDEAVDPLVMARALLCPLAGIPQVRLVVGTRESSTDRAGSPPADLLATLGGEVVQVQREGQAIAAYVRRRLSGLVADREIAVPTEVVDRLAARVGGGAADFLHARLLIAELGALPGPVTEAAIEPMLGRSPSELFADAVARLEDTQPGATILMRAVAMTRGRGLPIRDGIWTVVAAGLSGEPVRDGESVHDFLRIAGPYLSVHHEHDQTVYRVAHRTFEEYFEAERFEPARGHVAIVRGLVGWLRSRDADQEINPYVVHHLAAHAAAGGLAGWEELASAVDVFGRLDLLAVIDEALRSDYGLAGLPREIAALVSSRHALVTATPPDVRGILELTLARHYTGDPAVASMAGSWRVEWADVLWQPPHLVLTSHSRGVNAVTPLTRHGRSLLASGSSDGSVRVWDIMTEARELAATTDLRSGVTALAAAVAGEDGDDFTIVGRRDGTVTVWDPWTGQTWPLLVHQSEVTVLSVSRHDDAVMLASGDQQGWVAIQDVRTGAERRTWRHPGGSAVRTLTWHDRVLHIGYNDGTLRRWDVSTSPVPGVAAAIHEKGIRAAVAAMFGTVPSIVTAANDGQVVRWNAEADPPVGGSLLVRQQYGVRGLASWSDGRASFLATADNDGVVRVFDVTSGLRLSTSLSATGQRVTAIAMVSPDPARPVLALAQGKTVRVWDPRPGAVGAGRVNPVEGLTVLAGEQPVLAVLDSQRVEFRTVGGAEAGELRDLVLPHRAQDLTSHLDRGGRQVVIVATKHHEPVVLRSSRRLRAVAVPGLALTSFVRADGQTTVAAAEYDGHVKLWDGDDFVSGAVFRDPLDRPVHVLTSYVDPVKGTRLVTGGRTMAPRIWNPAGAESIELELRDTVGTLALAVVPTPRGAVLAAAGTDRTVRLWDAGSGDPLAPTMTHDAPVRALAAVENPDGSHGLITASDDGTVSCWNPANGERLWRITSAFPIRHLAVLEAGQLVLGGSAGVAAIRYDFG